MPGKPNRLWQRLVLGAEGVNMWGFFVNNWFVIMSVLTVLGLGVSAYLTTPLATAVGVKGLLKTYWREIFIGVVIFASLMYAAVS